MDGASFAPVVISRSAVTRHLAMSGFGLLLCAPLFASPAPGFVSPAIWYGLAALYSAALLFVTIFCLRALVDRRPRLWTDGDTLCFRRAFFGVARAPLDQIERLQLLLYRQRIQHLHIVLKREALRDPRVTGCHRARPLIDLSRLRGRLVISLFAYYAVPLEEIAQQLSVLSKAPIVRKEMRIFRRSGS
ncbi:MAG: hypothetical protein IH889_01835 [Planctomycetes bacterium]|nr:hypothetical protein [Planctomycetota bacterium]